MQTGNFNQCEIIRCNSNQRARSNNFLEQKRINNLDMSTYEYVEGDFPAIISQEIWDKAQAIRES